MPPAAAAVPAGLSGALLGGSVAAPAIASSIVPALAMSGVSALGQGIMSAIASKQQADLERETSLPGRARVNYSPGQLNLSQKLAQRFGDYQGSLDDVRTPLGRFGIEYGRVGDLAKRVQQRTS